MQLARISHHRRGRNRSNTCAARGSRRDHVTGTRHCASDAWALGAQRCCAPTT